VSDPGISPPLDDWWRRAVIYQVYIRSFALLASLPLVDDRLPVDATAWYVAASAPGAGAGETGRP
jgi:hypothetical protein